ncbi:Z1 domain-containing protein [Patescibacteria group bacterium]|nr:Z1 domain-containing protein [Patescibacteria group bacterium]
MEDNSNTIREINDFQDFLPLKHKITDLPFYIPESLKEAIIVFIIISAVRILRGQDNIHNSMLVNVSRFTGIQTEVRILIYTYLAHIRAAVSNHYALDEKRALQNTLIKIIHDKYEKIFSFVEFNWAQVQKVLNKVVSRIEVIEINSSTNAVKEIDYSKRNYPEGRHLIAVGGLSLSRGITLEGLSTTYFLRNSIMSDTLMQMGRWFGYRSGYEDLCRIYMPGQARGWYEYIASATEELRSEFQRMDKLNKTPKEFGLCVRNHPDSLIVTARNKMRTAKTVIRQIDLTGRLIETNRLYKAKKKVNYNLNIMADLLRSLKEYSREPIHRTNKHFLWKNIPYQIVRDFVELFQNHPESGGTDSRAVKELRRRLISTRKYIAMECIVCKHTSSR